MAGKYAELEGKTLLVCIGAMRCATSWLYYYLGAAPEVTVSPIKELHFFNAKFPENALADMNEMALRRLRILLERDGGSAESLQGAPALQASIDRAQMIYDDQAYFGHFARLCTPETTVLCDVTPAYAAIGRPGFAFMHRFVSGHGLRPKVLFVLRDPVERLWSQLRHMQHLNPAARAAERWREALESPQAMARADYRQTIESLEASFPEADVCYVFYENLFSEPALRALCRFAGIKYQPGRIEERANAAALALDLPQDARQAFREALDPQYQFCRDRFSDELPENWATA